MEASSPKEHQGSTSSSALSFAAASDSSIPPSVESLGEKPAGVSSHISSENSSEAGPTPESEGGCAPQQPDAASTLATPPDVVPSNPSFTSADPPTPSSVTAAHYSSAKGSRKHHSHHLRHDGSRHYGYSMPTALSQHYESRGSRGHQRGSRHHHINHRPLRFSGDTSTLTSTEDLEGLEARLASAARPIAPQRGHGGPLSSTTSSLSIITTNSLGSSTSSCTTGFSGSRESALQPYLPPPPLPVPAPPLSSLPSVAAPGCGFVLRIDPQRMREYPRGKVALAPGFSMRDWTMKVVEQAQLNKRYSSTTISPEPPALDPQVATAQYGTNTAHVLVRAGEEAAAADRGYAHVRRVYDRRQRFTAAEVAQHNTREDLWIVLHDVVYDCTEYQQYHPGGGAILLPCAGKDATALFSAFHHWISLEAMLGPYAVGVVEKSEVTL